MKDKSLNYDSKCTIVIPTYRRPNRLYRLLSYYNDKNVNYEIIVGDSSPDEIKKKNKDNILKLSNLNIRYIDKFHPDTLGIVKIINLVQLVNTKYCVFCADDDFIFPKAITKAVEFLEKKKNHDYISVGGQYIRFYTEKSYNNDTILRWERLYHRSALNISRNYTNPISRFIFLYAAYVPTFYNVHRTRYLKFFYKETMKLEQESMFNELFPSLLTVIYGKVKVLKTLYCARDAHQYIDKKRIRIIDYIKNRTYKRIYNTFKSRLVFHLTKRAHLTSLKAGKIVDNSTFLYRKSASQTIANSSNHIRFIMHYLGTYLKIFLPTLLLLLFRTLFINRFVYLKILMRKDFSNPSSRYYKDFSEFRKYILSFSSSEKD